MSSLCFGCGLSHSEMTRHAKPMPSPSFIEGVYDDVVDMDSQCHVGPSLWRKLTGLQGSPKEGQNRVRVRIEGATKDGFIAIKLIDGEEQSRKWISFHFDRGHFLSNTIFCFFNYKIIVNGINSDEIGLSGSPDRMTLIDRGGTVALVVVVPWTVDTLQVLTFERVRRVAGNRVLSMVETQMDESMAVFENRTWLSHERWELNPDHLVHCRTHLGFIRRRTQILLVNLFPLLSEWMSRGNWFITSLDCSAPFLVTLWSLTYLIPWESFQERRTRFLVSGAIFGMVALVDKILKYRYVVIHGRDYVYIRYSVRRRQEARRFAERIALQIELTRM